MTTPMPHQSKNQMVDGHGPMAYHPHIPTGATINQMIIIQMKTAPISMVAPEGGMT